MFCAKCGKELADGVRFCPSCGAEVAAVTASEPTGDVEAPAPVHAVAPPEPAAPASAPDDEAAARAFPIFGGAAENAVLKRGGQPADQEKPLKKRRRGAGAIVRNCLLVVFVALLSAAAAYAALTAYRDTTASSAEDAAQEDAAASDGESSDDVFVDEVADVAEGANEPVYTYTYSQIYQAVTLTATLESANEDAADTAISVETTETTWSYPQFVTTEGETTDALDAVNDALAADYEAALAASENWVEAEATSAQTIAYSDTVASLTGDYVSIRRYMYVTYWGAHGSESVVGLFYDLSTGEAVEPAEALGFTAEELAAMATEAIYAYLASDENFDESYFIDDAGTDAATLIEQAVAAIAADTARYYATADAIVVCTAPYELGDYSFGMQEIVIYAYTENVAVGEAVGYGTE